MGYLPPAQFTCTISLYPWIHQRVRMRQSETVQTDMSPVTSSRRSTLDVSHFVRSSVLSEAVNILNYAHQADVAMIGSGQAGILHFATLSEP